MRLTLRTLLAYLDDTLTPAAARQIGAKVAENPPAQDLIDRIKRVTRRRGLATPPTGGEGSPSDPNTVADYLSDALPPDALGQFEKTCLESDVHLAEVAACHQILTLVLSDQVRVPPTARTRMYGLVKGREAVPGRKPGATIPVGGVLEDRQPVGDDADAPLLLGLSAFSPADSWGRRLGRVGAVAVLVAGLAAAVWMALPPAEPVVASREPVPLSRERPRPEETVRPQPPESAPPPRTPVADAPGSRESPTTDPPPPKKDLAPKLPPPSPDRVAVGRVDKPAAVVVRPQPGGAGWSRVMPDDPAVVTTDRLVSLPGYWAVVRFDTDVTVDLWGNLPELFAAPLLESSVTPYLPADGLSVDLAVHAGRIYLGTTRPTGARVRLRFGTQVWDVALADATTEVVVEVTNTLAPGTPPEPPQTTAGLAVLAGSATVQPVRAKDPVTLPRGGQAFWDSKGGPPVFRPSPDPGVVARQAALLAKFQPSFDGQRAKAAREALDELSRNLADGGRVRAALAEGLQDRPGEPVTVKDFAAARIAVLAFAAVGDLPGLADSLTDPVRGLVRQTAAEGLRGALARDPGLAGPFRQTLVDKARLDDAQADAVLRLLGGFSDRERANPDTVAQLVEGLSAAAVCVRELSFQNLVSFIDPDDKANDPLLLRFDAGGPAESRDLAVKAWKKKSEDLRTNGADPKK